MDIASLKQAAAARAVDGVRSGMRLGLGSGHLATLARLAATGGVPTLRTTDAGAPTLSDGGNLLVDVRFAAVDDAAALAARLKLVPGVVETGLFVGLATRVLVAHRDGVRALTRGLARADPRRG